MIFFTSSACDLDHMKKATWQTFYKTICILELLFCALDLWKNNENLAYEHKK